MLQLISWSTQGNAAAVGIADYRIGIADIDAGFRRYAKQRHILHLVAEAGHRHRSPVSIHPHQADTKQQRGSSSACCRRSLAIVVMAGNAGYIIKDRPQPRV